jgi:hypothetical protein
LELTKLIKISQKELNGKLGMVVLITVFVNQISVALRKTRVDSEIKSVFFCQSAICVKILFYDIFVLNGFKGQSL